MCRALDDAVSLKKAIKFIGQLIDKEESEALQKRRVQKKKTWEEWAEPWKPVARDKAKLTSLLEIAAAVDLSETGFFSLDDAADLMAEWDEEGLGGASVGAEGLEGLRNFGRAGVAEGSGAAGGSLRGEKAGVEEVLERFQDLDGMGGLEGEGATGRGGVSQKFRGRPSRLLAFLLRYLPLISITVQAREGCKEVVLLCARPVQAHDHILQFATLAKMVREQAKETAQKARELPILKYLRFLSKEQDRRVFKGLLAQLTGADFVVKQYGWKRESIAAITEELSGAEFYMADLDQLMRSVAYKTEPSAYQRRKQRDTRRAELKVARFMLRKRREGGRPSKILAHACCLGEHIERAVENLGDGDGGKAERRRQDSTLHRGGRSTVTRIWLYVLECRCCRTGELISVSRKTVHRAMHPANCRSIAGRLHVPLADVRMHKVRAEDKEGNVDGKHCHVDWRASQDRAFATPCSTITAADDHAKVKPDINTSTSRHRVYHVCSNKKTSPDHDLHSKARDSNIIIDSIVLLTEDTAMNRERLAGTRRALERHGGKQALVSRNGGRGYAVLQTEKYNPSTAAQKINNVEQLWEGDPELFDSCSWHHYTDKGPDHNPEFREVIYTQALFFREKGLCYSSQRTHAGGQSAYNVGAERLNAVETKELCNVPIDSQPFGDAVDLERGVVDERKVWANLQWELDEVGSRLSDGEFCGFPLTVKQALPVECAGGCGRGAGECACELGYVSNSEREALRAYSKAGVRKRALWSDRDQAARFDELFDFVNCPKHTLLSRYGMEFLACWDEKCLFKCMDGFEKARRRLGSPAACCDHSGCRERTFLGTAQFTESGGHFQDSVARAQNEQHPPWELDCVDRCLPSVLLRQELERRNYLWMEEDVKAFIVGGLTGAARTKTPSLKSASGRFRSYTRTREHVSGLQHLSEVQQILLRDSQGMELAVGNDRMFWIGRDKGFVGNSTQSLRVVWLGISADDSSLYRVEGEDREDVAQRFAVDVALEIDPSGFRLPAKELERLMGALDSFQREVVEVVEGVSAQRQNVAGVKEECEICDLFHGEGKDVQVLCDSCNKGFHLDCLTSRGVLFPEEILEDGVDWECVDCMLIYEEEALSLQELESFSEVDSDVRKSRKGRAIRRPARFEGSG
ncbi:hypothetical protein KFL_002520100 [Klebsormidium nitens]|uniref:PHD-type domain-containing protein n=1 Tax=Klebsormidium nitens TaxID=105231 RepID=A0A1Y1I495_KLENI|nr:hypothetical protein KFL_002520100 [Klebsormidium nitens]|eukprot:GAQ85750.1 hypothetical protein KFL_002520100 [Klebsormidium nitens]